MKERQIASSDRRVGGRAEKQTILVIAKYYEPGRKAGGQLKALINLVRELSDRYDFRVLASDRDLGERRPYRGVPAGSWIQGSHGQVRYMKSGFGALSELKAVMADAAHSIIYLNSFFSPLFSLAPMILRRALKDRRPVVIAPRGEFSPGALERKRRRKRVLAWAADLSGLYRDVTWQATGPLEAEQIALNLPRSGKRIITAMEVPDPASDRPFDAASRTRVGERLKVIFLSRLAPVKNLEFALKVLAGLELDVDFEVAGGVENRAYWKRCERLMRQLPPNVRTLVRGHVDPSAVPGLLARSDLLFLPTKGENFGYVIRESLMAGTPVLISDRTPWPDSPGFACRALPLSRPEAFAESIVAYASLDAGRRSEARTRARALAESFANPVRCREQSVALFDAASGGGA
ncbi:MAG: glycosyltransferase family 4 protein [Spirochaetales bacterium]|nr:glycosyltransferase family 4 protein [Spirochaetales bacterium]